MSKNLTSDPVFVMPTDNAELIDRIGFLNEQSKKIESELAFLKEGAKARLEPGDYKGKIFKAQVAVRSRTGLDSAAIKEEMGEEWVVNHSKTTPYTEIRIVPNDDLVQL